MYTRFIAYSNLERQSCPFACISFFILYCILASCYIRLTLNICSFVHQCNTFTFYFLLIADMFRPHTAIFRCYSILSRSWCSVMPIFAYVMLPAMCQTSSPDVVLIFSVRLLEYLCCLSSGEAHV
jgi:hypothetical protein